MKIFFYLHGVMSSDLGKKILSSQKYTDTFKTCHPAQTK